MALLKPVTILLFLFFLSLSGISQPVNPAIDSLIHLISSDSYRLHFDSLRTNKGCTRKVHWFDQQSADHDACRDYIFKTFKKYLGEENVYLQRFEVGGRTGGLANVVAFKQGKSPSNRILVLSAHYDSYCSSFGNSDPECSPGANDNGTGVAAILEIARVLADVETERSILFAAWDLEERFTDGFASGSNCWFNDYVATKKKKNAAKKVTGGKIGIDKLVANINFDMFGNPNDTIDGKPVLWACSGNVTHAGFVDEYISTLNQYIPQIRAVNHGKMAYSDHYTFAARDIPSVENLESGYDKDPLYHTCSDNLENSDNIDFNFATNVTRGGMAFTLEMAGLFVPSYRRVISDTSTVKVYERPEAYTLKFKDNDYNIVVTNQFGNKIKMMKQDDVCFLYPPASGLYQIFIINRAGIASRKIFLQKKEGNATPFL
jgi:hypothetical protein